MPKFLHKKPRSVRDVLEDLGLPPETIEKAEQAGTSELLAIDGVVLPERGKLTIEELAAKVGVEVEVVRVFWRALGFVDPIDGELAFNKRDVTILKSLFELTNEELIDRELSMQLARVLGQSMAQLATAVVDAGESRSGADTDQSFALRAGALLPFSLRRHRLLVSGVTCGPRRVDVSSSPWPTTMSDRSSGSPTSSGSPNSACSSMSVSSPSWSVDSIR